MLCMRYCTLAGNQFECKMKIRYPKKLWAAWCCRYRKKSSSSSSVENETTVSADWVWKCQINEVAC